MKKRIISLALILCMVLSILPTGLVAYAQTAAPAETAKENQRSAGETITRAQWIQALVKAFDMTVEEAHAPDNYFSDLTGDEAYYRDILVAVQFGVVDIPAGEAINPEAAASREFAAQTLNCCLGFWHDSGEGYTFSESGSVTYPDDIQIAINRGWFSLSGNRFLPDQGITEAEKEAMLADAAAVLEGRAIDTGYHNTYVFQKDVIEIPQGTDVEILQNTVTIRDCPKALDSGDIFVVWYQSVPCAFAASSVEVSGAETRVTARAITDGSAVTDADAQGILDAEFAQFVPEDGTEVVYVDEVTGIEYEDAHEADRAIAAHAATRGSRKLKTLQLKKSIPLENGRMATVTAKVKNPVLNYKFSLRNKYASVILNADYEMTISASVDLTDTVLVKKLRLGFWGCPGIGGIDLNVLYNIGGSVSGSFSGSLCVGAEYRSGSGFSTPRDFKSKGFSFVIEASLKAGLQVSLGINDVPCNMLVGNVFAEVGVKGSIQRTSYSDNALPHVCLHTAMYLYLDTGIHLSYNIGGHSDNRSQSDSVWSESTSPVRVVHHYEDGKEVATCTRGFSAGSGTYHTPGSSNYWGSGWGKGSGSTGYDRNGNPVPVYEYTLEDGGLATITKYHGNGASVTIPGTLDGHTVTAIGGNAFSYHTNLESVSIPDSVTVIKEFAFSGCSSLQTVHLPDSIKEIDYHAFSYCTSLDWIQLPGHLETLGGAVFTGCDSLKSIFIPKSLKTANTYTSFYLGPFHSSGVEKAIFEAGTDAVIPNLFRGADRLKRVELLDTMTAIGSNAFDGCTALKAIQIPDSVTAIEGFAFRGCTSLQTVNIPDSVGVIKEYVFSGCSSLEEMELADSVREIGYHAFSYCTSLKQIKLSNRLRRLGGAAFTGCDQLKSITIPKSLEAADTYTSFYLGPFYGSGVENAAFEAGTTRVAANLFRGADRLKQVELLDTMTVIGSNAFEGCASLEAIQIPDSVTEISDRAFKYCKSLRSFRLPAGVTELGLSVFEGCTVLEAFTWDSPRAEIPEGTFFECTGLKGFALPDWITAIGENAFYHCTSLASVTGGSKVERIGDRAFYECTKLSAIEFFPALRSIGHRAFQSCTSLSSLLIPKGPTSIGAYAFQNCTSLVSASLPDTVSSIGAYLFDGCSALTKVELGAGLTLIPDRAFSNCSALESIALPYRIESIGDSAFLNDVKLKSVTILRRVNQIAENAFSYPGRLTVYGVSGTYAQTYAEEIGAAFVPIDHAATAITLDQTALTVNWNTSVQLFAEITPADFTDEVTWETSDPSVATVTDAGVVLGVGTGECTITVKAGNVTASCAVTVVGGTMPHVHSYTETLTPPTCTDQGFTIHTCLCGDSYVDSYTDALGHAWDGGVITLPPTQTASGVKTYTCTRCAAQRRETLPPTGGFTPCNGTDCPGSVFTDMPTKGNWAHDAIDWAVQSSVTAGTSSTTFSPEKGCTRAQVVTFLWRAAGQPAPTSSYNPFGDVKESAYYLSSRSVGGGESNHRRHLHNHLQSGGHLHQSTDRHLPLAVQGQAGACQPDPPLRGRSPYGILRKCGSLGSGNGHNQRHQPHRLQPRGYLHQSPGCHLPLPQRNELKHQYRYK